MNLELKGKIIWALEYVKANMDHIEEFVSELTENDGNPNLDNWITSEKEVDEIISAIDSDKTV
jgi:hypothetical protein